MNQSFSLFAVIEANSLKLKTGSSSSPSICSGRKLSGSTVTFTLLPDFLNRRVTFCPLSNSTETDIISQFAWRNMAVLVLSVPGMYPSIASCIACITVDLPAPFRPKRYAMSLKSYVLASTLCIPLICTDFIFIEVTPLYSI